MLLQSTAALEQPDLAERLFGTADKEAAQQKLAARLTELSADPKMVEASMGLTDEGAATSLTRCGQLMLVVCCQG